AESPEPRSTPVTLPAAHDGRQGHCLLFFILLCAAARTPADRARSISPRRIRTADWSRAFIAVLPSTGLVYPGSDRSFRPRITKTEAARPSRGPQHGALPPVRLRPPAFGDVRGEVLASSAAPARIFGWLSRAWAAVRYRSVRHA